MSALQRKLLLLFALLLAVQAGGNLIQYLLLVRESGRFGGDFISFWQAAHRVRAGDLAAIYNPEAWRRVLAAGTPHQITWFPYPPFALFGLWPLGRLSYAAAVAVWSVAPLPFYAALTWRLAKRTGLGETPDGSGGGGMSRAPAYAVLAALTLPLLCANLFSGQTGTFIAALFLGAAYFWPRRPILAGICIGLLAIKPQLGLLLPFALLAAGQWRVIAAAAATILALVVASTLWLGPAIWADYLSMTQVFAQLMGHGYAGLRLMALGPYISLQAAGAPVAVSAFLQAIVSLTVLAAIVRVFWRPPVDGEDGRLDLRLGLLAAGALLATPYALSYDTPMLALAILPLLARAWRRGWDGLELAAVTGLVVLPYATPILMRVHVPAGLGALLLCFWALWRRYAREAPTRDEAPAERSPQLASA